MAQGKPVILAEALNAGKEVFERAKQSLDKLPPAPATPAPATLSDAQQLVAEKQQALLHKEPKPKQKKREQTPGEIVVPGARVGGANSNSAYWTLVEEYFRDVTKQDVLNLLSFCVDPDEDDALLVPQLGRPAEDAKQPQPPLHLPSATAAKAGTATPSPVPGSAAVGTDIDDSHELKRSSRLYAKAQRRQEFGYNRYSDGMTSSADQFGREPQGVDAAGPLVPQLSSPYCLLEQLPTADLLLMVSVSMLLQQLSVKDLAAALGPYFTADSLAVLLQQAQQPESVLPVHDVASRSAAHLYDDGYRAGSMQGSRSSYGSIAAGGAYGMYSSGHKPHKSHRQKEKDAAAANAWACVSAGLGGPQVTEQQRAALIAWLQQQCEAPGVGEGRRGPIATPWSLTTAALPGIVAAAAAAVEPTSAAVQASAVVKGDAVHTGAAGADEQQQETEQQQPSSHENAASTQQAPAEPPVAAVSGVADAAGSNITAGANAAGVGNTPDKASGVALTDTQRQGLQLEQPQSDCAAAAAAAAAVSAAAAAVVAAPSTAVVAADPEVVVPVDPYEENLAQLEADAKKRAERRAAEVARRRLEARLELHPYIKTLLHRPLPAHIADPGWDIQENLLGDDEPDDTTAVGSAAAASNSTGAQGKVTSAAAGKKAETPGLSSTSQATAAGDSSGVAGDDAAAEDTAGLPPTGSSGKGSKAASRARSRGRGRGRKSGVNRGGKAAGAGAAGKAAGGAGAVSSNTAGAADGRGLGGKLEDRVPSSAAAQAVAAVIAAAPSEGGLDEQWSVLDTSADVLALAPDDEVLAELLTLQGELLQQVAINRARLGVVLQAALDDLPRQIAAQAERAKWEDDIVAYMMAVREARKAAKREKRELERRQAVEEAAAMLPLSPRHTAARAARAARENSYGRSSLRGGEWVGGSDDVDDEYEGPQGASPERPGGGGHDQAAGEGVLGADGGPLMDTLASRDNDDALCSICGEGHSEPPNQILFCERCDVAVHQICYGVDVIPEGEWLCWPCAQYEEQMRRQGVAQADIRPPRWQLGAGGGAAGGGGLTGGSRSVTCALCPMQCGAFKQVTDGTQRWVHVVCALWHAETKMPLDVNQPDIITGIEQLEPRLANPNQQVCQVCRRAVGVPVKCSFGHCAAIFHPLCGRARGWYLAIRPGGRGGSYLYKAYCAQHSEAQRQKDREAAERAAMLAQGTLPVPELPKPRRGRPPAGAYNLDDYDEPAEQQQQQQQQAAAAVPVPAPAEIDPAVLQALAVKEQKIWVLQGVRFELEILRMLADQVKRREKVKVQLSKMASEVHTARLEDPAAGLEALEKEMLEHAAILAALPADAADTADIGPTVAAGGGDEGAAVAGPAAAVTADKQQDEPDDGPGSAAAALDAAADRELEQPVPPPQQLADTCKDSEQATAPAAAAAPDVAQGLEQALDALHALGAEESAPLTSTAAAAVAMPEAPAEDDPVVEKLVTADAVTTQTAATAAEALQQLQKELDQQRPDTVAAPLAADVTSGELAVTAAEQQQAAGEPPVIESPTGVGDSTSSKRSPAAAAAAAAGEAALAKTTAAGRGKGRPPRQPTAGSKRGRAAAAAAAGTNSEQQPPPTTLSDQAASETPGGPRDQPVAVAANGGGGGGGGGSHMEVPVPVSASAKRRRTGGAGGGGGKRGASTAAAWKGATAANILEGDTAAAAAAGDDAEGTAGENDRAAGAAAAGQQEAAAAAAAADMADATAAVPHPDQPSAAAAGNSESSAGQPDSESAVPESEPPEAAGDDAPMQQQQQKQLAQQTAPAAAVSSRTGSRKRARPSDDNQAMNATGAAAGPAAAEQPAAVSHPEDAATTVAGQLSKASSTVSEELAAAAGGGGVSGSGKRSRARKELQMLKADLDHSLFQPVEGMRSRRSSRDGGAAAAAEPAAAAGQSKPGLTTIEEEVPGTAGNDTEQDAAVVAAAALAESFALDSVAVGDPAAVEVQPVEPAAAAAVAATLKGQQSGGSSKRQRNSKAARGGQQQQQQQVTSPVGAAEAAGVKSR